MEKLGTKKNNIHQCCRNTCIDYSVALDKRHYKNIPIFKITENLPPKNENFQIKNPILFISLLKT